MSRRGSPRAAVSVTPLAPAGLLLVVALCAAPIPAASQDTLRLGALQEAAVEADARAQQLAHQLQAHRLGVRNLQAERLPQFTVRGDAAHQSHVPTLPLAFPGQVTTAPRTRYQLSAAADQVLYDGGTLRRREALAYARHAELEAELHATLYPLRLEVAEAYFGALRLQVRAGELALLLEDLDAGLAQVRSAVRAGAALPADTAALQAERLRALQQVEQVAAGRAAALTVLGGLTGDPIGVDDVLTLPDLADAVARVQAAGGADVLRERPEFERLTLLRERLLREADIVAARTRPRLHAFGHAGVGRPGPFDLFGDGLNEYWQVGLRLQWQPWTWGVNVRERELLAIQRQVVDTEESALVAQLARAVQAETSAMLQLTHALELDERIIALREQVERQARRQFEERTLTASQYMSVRNDVFQARVTRQQHRVELEHARARYLTILGARTNSW
jgi:outer membrane protein TolC